MKAMIGGFLMFSIVGWALWALSAKTVCDQVQRFAAPVNLVSWGARELSANWIDNEERTSAYVWSAEARETAEKLIARTFFSKELRCVWSKP